MNIFIDCNIQHIKIRKSDLYITRLNIHFWVDGEHTNKIVHIESDSPQENSLNALDVFKTEVDNFKLNFKKEAFSNVIIQREKYRGFEVFTKLSVNNLIQSNKG